MPPWADRSGVGASARWFGGLLAASAAAVFILVLNTLLSTTSSGPQMTVVGFDDESPDTHAGHSYSHSNDELSRLRAAHTDLQTRYDHLADQLQDTQTQLDKAKSQLASTDKDGKLSLDSSSTKTNSYSDTTLTTAASKLESDTPSDSLELPGFCLEKSKPSWDAQSNGANRADCAAACISDPQCVSWTLKKGVCTLRGSFVSPCRQFESWRVCLTTRRRGDEADCHSGVIRPIPPRISASKVEQPAKLENVDLVQFGQCHNHSCLDVDHCAARYTGSAKFGFVLTHDLRRPEDRRFKMSLTYTRLVKAAKQVPADVILMVPNDTLATFPLTAAERSRFKSEGVKIHEVSWILPPAMRFTKKSNWCGFQDFIRINGFGIPGYDALISYDSDIFVRANMASVFRCAAQNYMLITAGPASPCNIGFVAFRPDPGLVNAAIHFAQRANFTMKDGWDNAGWGPGGSKFTGGECGQGFYWTLFFNNGAPRGTALAEESYRAAGISQPKGFQIDRCRYNFQRWGWWKTPWGWLGDEKNEQCDFPGFDCDASVRAVHKAFDRRTHQIIPVKEIPAEVPKGAILINRTYGNPPRTDWALSTPRDFNSLTQWRCTDGWTPKE